MINEVVYSVLSYYIKYYPEYIQWSVLQCFWRHNLQLLSQHNLHPNHCSGKSSTRLYQIQFPLQSATGLRRPHHEWGLWHTETQPRVSQVSPQNSFFSVWNLSQYLIFECFHLEIVGSGFLLKIHKICNTETKCTLDHRQPQRSNSCYWQQGLCWKVHFQTYPSCFSIFLLAYACNT